MITRRTNLLTLTAGLPVEAQLKEIFDRIGGKTKGTQQSSGIKEALIIGIGNAVRIASRPDGYFANALIKILLPEKLRKLEKGLRMVGGGRWIDDFVRGMNRAAEEAAPIAKEIFTGAIKKLSIGDAVQILRGGGTAAADFFRKATGPDLVVAFRRPISESMQSVGAMLSYEDMIARFRRIPFMKADSIDIEGYVARKGVDGLFYLVGQEEKQIRKSPAARVTPLLKEVFGSLGGR